MNMVFSRWMTHDRIHIHITQVRVLRKISLKIAHVRTGTDCNLVVGGLEPACSETKGSRRQTWTATHPRNRQGRQAYPTQEGKIWEWNLWMAVFYHRANTVRYRDEENDSKPQHTALHNRRRKWNIAYDVYQV